MIAAKEGDILIWHANLIHGGSKRNDTQLSRRAMVGHYFGEGALCFGDIHEIKLDPYEG
jgi:ectoine hydroxylase-related dioxygenase (phytanoyl-CoA dioxygenase family)